MVASSFRIWLVCLLTVHASSSVHAFVSQQSAGAQSLVYKRKTTHQLSAFQVSPFLRFRENPVKQEQGNTAEANSTAELSTAPPTSAIATSQQAHRSSQSLSLIRAIWLNQGAIFLFATVFATVSSFVTTGGVDFSSFHWAGDTSFYSLFDWRADGFRVAEGILATIPMVMLGCTLEQSDRRDASQVNFSTTNMCITLFGRRKSSADPDATDSTTVMALAALIALSTGISEEIVFRGYVPTGIEAVTHSMPIAAVGQAALFALAHISPKSSIAENKVVGGLQFVNGLWYGVVYAATGGDVLPCIIAHALYDSHILCETWFSINNQMDYTQRAFQRSLDTAERQALKQIQDQAGPALTVETLNLARRFFYAFDYEHKGSLCLSDVHRAINYAFLKDAYIPDQEVVDDAFESLIDSRDTFVDYPGNRLTVSEFLRLLFALKSHGATAV